MTMAIKEFETAFQVEIDWLKSEWSNFVSNLPWPELVKPALKR